MPDTVLPEFYRPKTMEESSAIAHRLTGDYWAQFSPPRPSSGSDRGYVGGQHFLALRCKGPRWYIVQPLCWLCGQGVLSPPELINALGRRLGPTSYGGYEEKISPMPVTADPTFQVIEKTSAYGFATWPIKDFIKITGIRSYDDVLPKAAQTPYVYVIEDTLGDVKVGISNDPQQRFRQVETTENTKLKQWHCTKKPTRYALTIEQTVLNRFGKGRNPRKQSEEWLWQVTFEEAKAAVECELTTY